MGAIAACIAAAGLCAGMRSDITKSPIDITFR